MKNIKDIRNNWKQINVDYNYTFLSRARDQNKGKTQSQHRTKREENLHKLAHDVILPTDAFKLQISAQKSTLLVVTCLQRQAKKNEVTIELHV